MSYEEIKAEICDVCHKMWQLGWVAANDGNVTVKLDDGTFLATPTGISKSFITPEKLVRIDAEGKVLEAKEGYRRCCAACTSAYGYGLCRGAYPTRPLRYDRDGRFIGVDSNHTVWHAVYLRGS